MSDFLESAHRSWALNRMTFSSAPDLELRDRPTPAGEPQGRSLPTISGLLSVSASSLHIPHASF
jgi:hypothetical protein